MVNKDVKSAVIIYLLFVVVILINRPRILFEKPKEFKIRKFGLGKGKTLFSLHICLIFLSIIVSFCTFKSNVYPDI